LFQQFTSRQEITSAIFEQAPRKFKRGGPIVV